MNNIKIKNNEHLLIRSRYASSSWEDEEYYVYWEGLVFVNGIPSGTDSVKTFIEELRKKSIQDACSILKGTFFISIENKFNGDLYAFVDNSGLYQAFYTKIIISNSFLELVKYHKYKVSDLNPDSIVEFLYFGYLLFNKTFFKSISRISRDKILYFSKIDDQITSIDKNISEINEPLESGLNYFDEVFEGIAASIKNCNVSIDLTGGTDSRLIALLLGMYGLTFEAAVSGGTVDYEEILFSKKVATSLKLPWYSTIHSLTSLEEDFSELFYVTDGLISLSDYHCSFQLQKTRYQRGIDTVISGAGGDFYKDVFWLQDFPFYFKKNANIERFVDTRLMTLESVQSLLTREYFDLNQTLRSKIIQGLNQYRLDSSTKTYDNISFNCLMRDLAGRELTNHSFYTKAYAPFLDLDIVRMGFNLPIKMRIFNRFHRIKLTKINPLVARLPTTENGMTASSDLFLMLHDVPKYVRNRIKRLLIKLNLQKKPITYYNHPDFYFTIRRMSMMKDSIELLKETGIVSKKYKIEHIDNVHLGTFLSLAMLVKYMSQNS